MLLAEKLLTTIFDLEQIQPNFKWSDEELRGNPPRYIRYQQIKSMLTFLGFDSDPGWFMTVPINESIIDDKEDIYFEILNNIPRPKEVSFEFKTFGDILATFMYLYKFRKHLHYSTTNDI